MVNPDYIIDPSAPSGFAPASRGQPPIEILDFEPDVRDEPRLDRRPSLQQRMSTMSVGENRPNIVRVRSDSIPKRSKNYIYFRLEKEGEDWSRVRKNEILARQDEMETLAKKGRGTVLKMTQAMGNLRAQQLQQLVKTTNVEEANDGPWEVVWLDTRRETVRSTGRPSVRSMDVVLGRVDRNLKLAKVRSKSKSGEVVEIVEKKPKSEEKSEKKKDEKKDKKDGKKEPDFDEDDPWQVNKLFHKSGKPMDKLGPIEYRNAGLPESIPRDEPIGKKPEKKRDGKRSKSRDRIDIVDMTLGGPLAGGPLDSGIIGMGQEFGLGGHGGGNVNDFLGGGRPRSRRQSKSGGIRVDTGRSRSRSRRAQSGSRRRSSSRPESIQFPPTFNTRRYFNEEDGSTDSSDESRYGLDKEERSSYTSNDTFGDIRSRGSRYDDDPRYRREHKVHRRGSSRSPKQYYYEEPSKPSRRGSRRYSKPYHHREPIPEDHQIGYYEPPRTAVIPRGYVPVSPGGRPVQLHYGDGMVSVNNMERTAQSYMDGNIREEYNDRKIRAKNQELDRREREIQRREQAVDDRDYTRRESQRRYSSGYGYDDGYHY